MTANFTRREKDDLGAFPLIDNCIICLDFSIEINQTTEIRSQKSDMKMEHG